MIVLHHCVSARSFRPLWMLEELRLDYELNVLPFPPREQNSDYRAVNPLGTVPAFFDGSVCMTESAAICQYLVTRYGPTEMNVGLNEESYGEFLNWLHFGEATLTFPQTIVLRYSRFEAPERRLPQAAADYTRWFLSRLRSVESAVSSRESLCGGRFTAADVSVGYALMLAEDLDLAWKFSPGVMAYWQRLKSRAAFKSALERQGRAALEQGVSPVSSARSATVTDAVVSEKPG